MSNPEPRGKAGPRPEVVPPELRDLLSPEELSGVSGSSAPDAEPADETLVIPSNVLLDKSVSDWITMVASAADAIEPQHASVGVQQLRAGVRDLQSAVQRKDGVEVVKQSILIGAFALTFFMLIERVTHKDEEVSDRGEEEEAEEEGP